MPSPVRRIAPKPSRFTGRSPPRRKEDFGAGLDAAEASFCNPATTLATPARVAPKNFPRVIAGKVRRLPSTLNTQPSTSAPAPPAIVVPRNFRRVTPGCFEIRIPSEDSSAIKLRLRSRKILSTRTGCRVWNGGSSDGGGAWGMPCFPEA